MHISQSSQEASPKTTYASSTVPGRRVAPAQPRYTENWIRDEQASEALAMAIQDFWVSRGFPAVRVWVEPARFHEAHRAGTATIYVIRSNLINGMPPACQPARNGAAPFAC